MQLLRTTSFWLLAFLIATTTISADDAAQNSHLRRQLAEDDGSNDEVFLACRECLKKAENRFCYDDNQCYTEPEDVCTQAVFAKIDCNARKECIKCRNKQGHTYCKSMKKCLRDDQTCLLEGLDGVIPDVC